jgi:hypothetical protein
MLRSRLVRGTVVLALIAIPLSLLGGRALAIVGPEYKVLFGPIGVGVGQGVRISVYTTGEAYTGGIAVPDQRWEFTVKTFNTQGVIVHERRFRVAPGAIASSDIKIGNPDEFPADRLGRRTLRAEVIGIQPPPDPEQPPPEPDKYAATLEVYSLTTGHTNILIGGRDTLSAVPGLVP